MDPELDSGALTSITNSSMSSNSPTDASPSAAQALSGSSAATTPAPATPQTNYVPPVSNGSDLALDSTNPYNATASAKKPSALSAFAKGFNDAQSKNQSSSPSQGGQVQMPGNSYSALFGTQTQTGEYGGGRIGVQAPMQMPMAPPVQMPAPPPAQIAAPPMAPPMPTVSDVRAKYKIIADTKARNELDSFLQNVYNSVKSKGKK